jgi:hypothetical protein
MTVHLLNIAVFLMIIALLMWGYNLEKKCNAAGGWLTEYGHCLKYDILIDISL